MNFIYLFIFINTPHSAIKYIPEVQLQQLV